MNGRKVLALSIGGEFLLLPSPVVKFPRPSNRSNIHTIEALKKSRVLSGPETVFLTAKE